MILYWQSSLNLDDGWIVELPLYAIFFSFHDKIGSMREDKDPEDSSISHTGTFFLFSVRRISFIVSCAEKRLCLFFDRSPFVFWPFYKVSFKSISLFWIRINYKSAQSLEICNIKTWILFITNFNSKNCLSNHQSTGK